METGPSAFAKVPDPALEQWRDRSAVLAALAQLEPDLWRHICAHLTSLVDERNLPRERRTKTRLALLAAVRLELAKWRPE